MEIERLLELALSALNRACGLSEDVNHDALVREAIAAIQADFREDEA